MDKTARIQVPVEPEMLKSLKLLATARSSSISELVRVAIEQQYGDSMRDIERRFARRVSEKANKGTR
jgi:hypothetical protein